MKVFFAESKITLESRLKSWRNCLDVDLGSLRLTSLYFLDALIHVKFLDISRNELTRLGKSLNLMVCLEVLIADDNKISTIQSGFQLESLRILSLKFNSKCALIISTYLLDINWYWHYAYHFIIIRTKGRMFEQFGKL